MVVLKKIKAATLVETLVASVIIVIVFLIASMSLNNVFKGMVTSDGSALENRIEELRYFVANDALKLPFYEEMDRWDISIESHQSTTVLTYLNKSNSKEKKIILDETN